MSSTILAAGAGGGFLVGTLFKIFGWDPVIGVVIGFAVGSLLGWLVARQQTRRGP